ncbi:unnamed protein product [Caenorhabditis angaria]|uniref:Uncharacterized protein n=1 Tax=Caenorhabditis angaria TaxID=860376 RepID=A0A9P1MTI6_9PELO|nr:unnamed protein product [Caenorhabditis angaria]
MPHFLDEAMYSNNTKRVVETYKTFPNGSLYYDSVDEFGNIHYYELGEWFVKFLNGEMRYSYGNTFFNYCRERIIPKAEWMTSITRSLNHMILSQVLFRIVILSTLTFSLFQCLILRYLHDSALFGWLLITNELIHNLSLFAITCLHSDQDAHLIHFTRLSLIAVTFTTVIKLIVNSFLHNKNKYIQLICMISISFVILSHNTIIQDYDDFIKSPTCDSMTTPSVVFSQLLVIFSFGLCSYLQCLSMRGLQCMTGVTECELQYQQRFCAGGQK